LAQGYILRSDEKKSLASGGSAYKLKLPEELENGCVGNSNLQGNNQGPVYVVQGSARGPENPIKLTFFENP